jgi:S-adenosylmethionine synthetase
MGRNAYIGKATFYPEVNGNKTEQREVDFFAWEKLDYVDKLKEVLRL